MTKKSKIILTTLAALILVLVLVNILISIGNQSVQAEVSNGQQVIAQTLQIESLNRQLINVLANLALKTDDEQLKALLSSVGINLQAPPATKAPGK